MMNEENKLVIFRKVCIFGAILSEIGSCLNLYASSWTTLRPFRIYHSLLSILLNNEVIATNHILKWETGSFSGVYKDIGMKLSAELFIFVMLLITFNILAMITLEKNRKK